ncbi:ATP-grasp domain-containing protein [Sorangium sp. So ce385]|uniref:ATP-grasp domain-containing protein n=1 Tax=Sorangium sp. So ce385 TaxID=3133308 RepID=UPI003F5C5A7C
MNIAYVVMDGYRELMAARPGEQDETRVLPREFARLGAEMTTAAWRDPEVDWARFDAVLPKACWDYAERPIEFFAWLDRLRDVGARLLNPLELVRWNSDKRYLLDLRGAGVSVAPLVYVDRGGPRDLRAELASLGWGELVFKPAISAGAYRTFRASSPDAGGVAEQIEVILRDSGLLVQPFFPEIPRDGEWSFLFFGGEFSHALLKVPSRGDFRTQATFGATVTAQEPPPTLLDQAAAVVGALPGKTAYARVDGFIRDGRLQVMEVELIEPYLYLEHGGPLSARRFCEAVVARIGADRAAALAGAAGPPPPR